jgi:rhamnosyltransferase
VEVHARSFNYPKASKKVELKDKAKLGIKACFLSNSFAAYRLQALQQAGGFPSSLPLGEDTYTAAQLLKAGHRIAYQAAASVYHSHNYNGRQDFQRMFDTGVFHAQNQWLIQTFGSAEGEGIRLLKSQWAYLTQSHPTEQNEQNEQNDQNDQSDQEHPNVQKPNFLIGMAQILAINFTKLVGYKIGRAYTCLPKSLVIKFAMHKPFWQPKP